MINKFRHKPQNSQSLLEVPSSVADKLGNALSFTLTPSTNPIWKVLIEQKYFYLKVENSSKNAESLLELEYRILSSLYSFLEVKFIDIDDFIFLLIPELSQNKYPDYRKLFSFLGTLNSNSHTISGLIPEQRSFLILLEKSESSLDFFSSRKLIHSNWIKDLGEAIQALKEHYLRSPKIICHGDVSSKNIYNFHDSLILLDWEDCFWGYEGFDYIYWLTFMNNMDQLKQSSLEKIPLDASLIRASYLLIVLLKEFLHFDNQEGRNRITLEKRLSLFDFRISKRDSL